MERELVAADMQRLDRVLEFVGGLEAFAAFSAHASPPAAGDFGATRPLSPTAISRPRNRV